MIVPVHVKAAVQMVASNFLINEINKKFGAVTRARECYLYTKKGQRLLDLWQLGGRAILGWGNSKPQTIFKNVLNRGISGFFHTEFDESVQKSVSSLLESPRICLFYNSKTEALKTALTFSCEDTNFYRPWNSVQFEWKDKDCVILEPFFAWAQNIFIVAVKPELFEIALACQKQFSQGIFLPAPLSAAVSRSFYDLKKELPNRSEKDWFIYDKILVKYWTRKGPYLFPKVPQEKYFDFALQLLDCNIVVSPDFFTPSIVPFHADIGNFTKLKNLNFEF